VLVLVVRWIDLQLTRAIDLWGFELSDLICGDVYSGLLPSVAYYSLSFGLVFGVQETLRRISAQVCASFSGELSRSSFFFM